MSQLDSSRRGTSAQALSPSPGSPTRDSAELTKSTRRRSSTGAAGESPARDKPDKSKQRRSTRNAANELLDGVKPTRHAKDSNQGSESTSKLPEIPKKIRRKKSKDGGSSVSSRSRSRAQALEADDGAESLSVSKTSNKEQCHSSSGLYPFEEGAEKGLTEVS
uniref:Uncharacterized protein n=1 Tax=Rhizophora mucronata TaxID=61149 RepID=A0A2P2N084_RHIMU